jgi:hypothetical protein
MDMRKRWLEWFTWEDEADCRWALGYLAKAGEIIPWTNAAPRDRLRFLIEGWPARARDPSVMLPPTYNHYRALEDNLRRAHYLRCKRAEGERTGYKTYNFLMKISAHKPLSRLAAMWGVPLNKAAEHLIFQGAGLQREFENQRKSDVRQVKAEAKKQKEVLKDRLKAQRDEIKALKQEITELKGKLIRREVTTIVSRHRRHEFPDSQEGND